MHFMATLTKMLDLWQKMPYLARSGNPASHNINKFMFAIYKAWKA